MVKYFYKICLLIFIGTVILTGCRVDLLGFIISTDLDERLRERYNFTFIERDNAPPLSLGDEYSFIVVADTHISNNNTRGFERLKYAIDCGVKFVVVLGDITQRGSEREVRKFIDIADTLGVPVFPVIGNHDIYFGNWSVWREKIGSTRYRIDSGGTTLFILDSANTFYGRDQLSWLQSERYTAGERVFVFSHTNLFVEHPFDANQNIDMKERARLVSILRNRADFMFTGHVHRHITKSVGGVRYINVEAFRRNRAYLRLTVTPTGIEYQLRRL